MSNFRTHLRRSLVAGGALLVAAIGATFAADFAVPAAR